ncbi:NADase-type glycan-binding domain-containing protein [Streptomyces globisporus]|uniref:Zinc ribbon domain-containing protein n=1 Tax=Streptomyces globisporus TaxID=1908 RepID=A0A423V1I5_STRGL|nr:zinc ribbon domain-containing protein [Streptomyces globisporus]ROV68470.1 zinc ribbon domain-containing protein [Streptomyces globisporus]
MRSCPACGTANGESDDFCGNCGAYLGWSSEPVRRGRTPEPEPEVVPDPAHEPPAKPVAETEAPAPEPRPSSASEPEPARTDEPEPAPEPGAKPEAGADTQVPEARPAPPQAPPTTARPATPARPEQPPEPPKAPRSAPPVPPTPPVRPAPAPVRPGVPASATTSGPGNASDADEPVGAVQPARPVARRPLVRPVAADEAPDGPPCPACGTPNLAGRKFCRRCAAPLQVREQPAALPWWRTVWPFRRRVRGGSGRALRRTLLVLAVAGLVLAGFLFFPLGRYAFEDVRDKLGGTAEISPTGVTASAAAPGHPGSAAIDGLTNKYWGAPALGASLTCSFGAPFRLVGIVVHTGVSKEPQEFRRGARPTRADLLVTTKDGEVHKKAVTFNDKPGKQTVRMGISDVRSVELVLREATGQGEGRPVAVGEVEFFRRT